MGSTPLTPFFSFLEVCMSERQFFILMLVSIIGFVVMYSVDQFTEAMKDPSIAARDQYKSCVHDTIFRGGKPEVCEKILEPFTVSVQQRPQVAQ